MLVSAVLVRSCTVVYLGPADKCDGWFVAPGVLTAERLKPGEAVRRSLRSTLEDLAVDSL
jgi:hypothetical protein